MLVEVVSPPQALSRKECEGRELHPGEQGRFLRVELFCSQDSLVTKFRKLTKLCGNVLLRQSRGGYMFCAALGDLCLKRCNGCVDFGSQLGSRIGFEDHCRDLGGISRRKRYGLGCADRLLLSRE